MIGGRELERCPCGKLTAADVQKNERHNERMNESYANMNVDMAQIPLHVPFKDESPMRLGSGALRAFLFLHQIL